MSSFADFGTAQSPSTRNLTTALSATTDEHRAQAELAALGYGGRWPALLDDLNDHLAPDRPCAHGRVVRADRGAATVATTTGTRRIIWTPATPPPVTGDWVLVSDDDVLIGIVDRATAMTRPRLVKRPNDQGEQVLAANPDLVGVLIAAADEVRVRRLERGLVMAYESGALPLVILTKVDLAEDLHRAIATATATAVGVDVVAVSSLSGDGVAALRARLAPDRTIVLLGGSGVGKSMLTNALVGREVLATGDVRAVDGKGRHTTTHRELVALPSGGAVLDTPGLRTLGLGQVQEGMDSTFPDIAELTTNCRFGDCRHEKEPGCAVIAALEGGTLDGDRFDGWTRIRAASENAALRADIAAYRSEARSWGKLNRDAQRLRREREGRP